MERVPMTKEGAEALRNHLDYLKRKRRPEIVKAIAEAREHGDLRENAEYHAAKEDQGMVEAKIKQIENKLANAQVIDVTQMPNNGKVIFGSTVKLQNHDTDEEEQYQIVGEDEADIKENKISVTSPLARALIGKFEGDDVDVDTPNGRTQYEVTEVLYI
jgi:transcription elongation factor GreA